MNRSLALSLFLGIAIIAGILLLFPSLWTLLLLLLLGLVSGLVILVRRHLTVHQVLTPETPWPGSRAAAGTSPASGTATASAHAAADTAGDAATGSPQAAAASGDGMLDSSLFSRFRERLEEAETPAARAAAPAPDYDSPEGVTDRVNLSSAARRAETTGKPTPGAAAPPSTTAPDKASPGKASVPPAPSDRPPATTPARPPSRPSDPQTALADEEVEVDIFDDLRTDPAAIVAGKPASAAAPPAPPREEPLDVPAEDPAVASTVDDGPALLHMAEDALARGDLSGARAGLNNYFAAMAGHEAAIPWQAHQARLRLSIADGKPEAVLEHFEQMLKQGFTPEQARMAETIDAWLSPLADASAALLRVSLLVRTLTYFRQAGDREAMDRTYRQIATAQEATGDERKLVQFLKNHLEIKKVMSDQEGQLDLIDQIGNRLYRLGETEEAKAFYEQGLTLRAQLEGGTAPGATDTDPPPAPADVAATEAGGAAEPDTPAESPVAPPPRKDDA